MRAGGEGVSRTTLDGLLKRVYSSATVTDLLNKSADTYPKLKKSSKAPKGDGFYGPVLVAGNEHGQGSQNELEATRTAGYQKVKQYKVLPTVFTHKIRLSGLSLAIGEGNEESFSDNLTFQMDNGIDDSTKELNAQCYRDGSGKLGQVNGAVSGSDTVTIDHGIMTHFRVGMYVDVINGSAVKQIDSKEIIEVDIPNNQIVLASSQSCDDDSWIYREDVADNAPADGKELSGFPRITDDGTDFATYENITRLGAGYVAAFKGLEIDAGSANLSDDLLRRAAMRGKTYANAKYNKIRSNTTQYRRYLATTLPQVQFEKGKERNTGITEAKIYWDKLEWILDTDCGFDEVILNNDDLVEKYVVRELHWDDEDGKIIKHDSGYDAYYGLAKAYVNLGTPHPRGAAIRIHTLSVPTF